MDIIRRTSEASRYDSSFFELTRAALTDDNGSPVNRWVDFASELSRAAASEFEEYVRGQICIYQVSGVSENVSKSIYEEVLLSVDETDSIFEAESRAYERLDRALAEGQVTEADAESTLEVYIAEEISKQSLAVSSENNISVFSQCLIGVSPGSKVGLIKLNARIAIIPDRETALFSMHRISSNSE